MDDGEVFSLAWWDFDPRRRFGERLRREELERQVSDGFPKFGAVGAVPGINFVEGLKHGALRGFSDADEVEAGVGDGSGFVGEADQWKSHPRGPDFGVISSCRLQRGQRQDYIANSAGTDQEPFHL
jgi:hypothetical protein